MSGRFVSIAVMGALTLVGVLGCGPKGTQADEGRAKETLQRALDAWQKGDSLEGFQKSSPQTAVVEPLWQKGTRLVKYEIQGNGKPAGFDLRMPVKLSLEDREGKKTEQTALYTISTSPSLVIVREDR